MAVQGYSARQIALHWVVAVLIAVQFLFEDGISGAFRQIMREGTDPGFSATVLLHVAAGGLVLLLVLLRLVLRLRRGAPPAPAHESAVQKLVAGLVHWGLYLLMVLIPVSGMVAWFGGVGDAGEAHEVLTKVLLAAVAVHVLGALVGQFVQKTGVMARMVRPGR